MTFWKLVTMISFCATTIEVVAQNTHWQGIVHSDTTVACLYEDTSANALYIGGLYSNGICKYDGNTITHMGSNYSCSVSSMIKYNDTLYVAQNCGVHGLMKWTGTNWDTTPSVNCDGPVNAL